MKEAKFSETAPIVYFDGCTCYETGSIFTLTLAAIAPLPIDGGRVGSEVVATGFLKGDRAAFQNLQEAIEKALLQFR